VSVRAARGLAWLAAFALLGLAARLTAEATPVVRMVGIIGALLAGMKTVVIVEWKMQTGGTLSPARGLAFTLGWPGMRPSDFAERGATARPLSAWPGGRALAVGTAFVFAARAVLPRSEWVAYALALPGFSLILHFGFFRLLAAFWRSRGFDVAPPFDAPLLSTSLGEFWSRRWNRAFSDMTALVVYRPVSRWLGIRTGLFAAFVFSGVLHELAISVPARGGYGGPFAYFLLHALVVGVERALQARGGFRWPMAWARAWTAFWLVAPLPILFHRPFLDGVVRPLLG
jgi:alginate O-acetyltransferase complex protein AlgI